VLVATHVMLPRIDLPTFVALDPQATSITLRDTRTTAKMQSNATNLVVEGYETTSVVDSSTQTASRLRDTATTISVRRTEADMILDQYQDGVDLDGQQVGVLLDA
jgi:hypothetical protein